MIQILRRRDHEAIPEGVTIGIRILTGKAQPGHAACGLERAHRQSACCLRLRGKIPNICQGFISNGALKLLQQFCGDVMNPNLWNGIQQLQLSQLLLGVIVYSRLIPQLACIQRRHVRAVAVPRVHGRPGTTAVLIQQEISQLGAEAKVLRVRGHVALSLHATFKHQPEGGIFGWSYSQSWCHDNLNLRLQCTPEGRYSNRTRPLHALLHKANSKFQIPILKTNLYEALAKRNS